MVILMVCSKILKCSNVAVKWSDKAYHIGDYITSNLNITGWKEGNVLFNDVLDKLYSYMAYSNAVI